jgi:hypothetical protein
MRRFTALRSGLAGRSGRAATQGARELALHGVEEASAATAQNCSLATEEGSKRRGPRRRGRGTILWLRSGSGRGSRGRHRSRRLLGLVVAAISLGSGRGRLGKGALLAALLAVEEDTDLDIDQRLSFMLHHVLN